jgi:hypothetical protein
LTSLLVLFFTLSISPSMTRFVLFSLMIQDYHL